MSDLGSLVAVAGTLVGALGGSTLTGLIQGRLARTARRETWRVERRVEALAAFTALVSALSDHRRAMWVLGDRRLAAAERLGVALDDVDDPAVTEAQAVTHDTRAAVTAPVTTVCVLVPALAKTARAAEQATYAMRRAVDVDELEELRQAARDACDRLVEEAGPIFNELGVAA